MPIVSIILPTYDRLAYLREAVASVQAQTVPDWELFIVDDGSTDDTAAWVQSLDDTRITLITRAHTGNKAMLRNLGIAAATTTRIAFLDSDDRWPAGKLERQIAFHDANPRVRWSYTGRSFIDGDGAPIPSTRFRAWEPHSGWVLDKVVSHRAAIALPSVMAERSLLREVGGFDESFGSAEDYELWVRLAECAECGVIADELLEVRKHRAILTQRPDVALGFARIYHELALRTSDPRLRSEARRREAASAVDAAERLGERGQWRAAAQAVFRAARIHPLKRFVVGAAIRLARRRLAALTHRAAS
jgi:glycosyltransferase involved in cell wall biosynthesis